MSESPRQTLIRCIDEVLSKSDLRELCFSIGLDIDNVRGEIKKDQIIDLIEQCKRRGWLPRLQQWLEQNRPKRDWKTKFTNFRKPIEREKGAQKPCKPPGKSREQLRREKEEKQSKIIRELTTVLYEEVFLKYSEQGNMLLFFQIFIWVCTAGLGFGVFYLDTFELGIALVASTIPIPAAIYYFWDSIIVSRVFRTADRNGFYDRTKLSTSDRAQIKANLLQAGYRGLTSIFLPLFIEKYLFTNKGHVLKKWQ